MCSLFAPNSEWPLSSENKAAFCHRSDRPSLYVSKRAKSQVYWLPDCVIYPDQRHVLWQGELDQNVPLVLCLTQWSPTPGPWTGTCPWVSWFLHYLTSTFLLNSAALIQLHLQNARPQQSLWLVVFLFVTHVELSYILNLYHCLRTLYHSSFSVNRSFDSAVVLLSHISPWRSSHVLCTVYYTIRWNDKVKTIKNPLCCLDISTSKQKWEFSTSTLWSLLPISRTWIIIIRISNLFIPFLALTAWMSDNIGRPVIG